MSRKVIFWSTQNNKKIELETSAETFGTLCSELGVTPESNTRYYIAQTRNSLENLDATLPEGEFTLVASPRNNKAAVDYNQVDDIPTSQLREAFTRLTNIINAILKERGENLLEDCEECQEPQSPPSDPGGWL